MASSIHIEGMKMRDREVSREFEDLQSEGRSANAVLFGNVVV